MLFFFKDYGAPRDLPSFPTRRSSDLVENVRRLISSRQVTTFITNHTQGSLILRPPGIRAFGPTIDEPMYKDLGRSEEHTSELQSRQYLVCRLLLEKKNTPPSTSRSFP